MTKNLLNKIKSSLQSSSKKVHDEKLQNTLQEEPELMEFGQISDKFDRSQLYRVAANNYQTNKMIKKVPFLLHQNQQLRHKVSKLQFQVLQLRNRNQAKRTLSQMENSPDPHDSQQYIRIQNDCKQRDRASSSRWGQLLRQRIKTTRHRDHHLHQENSRYNSAEKRKRNFSKLSAQVIHYFQAQIQQLKLQNQHLNIKCQQFVTAKKQHTQDIDKIKKSFEQTLQKQQEMLKKQQTKAQERIKNLQLKVSQLQGQKQVIKMHNWILTQKIADYDISAAKQRKYCDEGQVSAEKWPQINKNACTVGEGSQPEGIKSGGGSRIVFNYHRQ